MTQSLSEKHQLLQALYAVGSLFRNPLQYGSTIPFEPELQSSKIQEAISRCQQSVNNENTVICAKLTLNGVTYKKDLVVLLQKQSGDVCENYECGVIKLVLLQNNQKVFFVVGKSFASYLSDTGVHKIENCIKNRFHCVSLESLLDLYPLEVYSLPARDFLALKHTV